MNGGPSRTANPIDRIGSLPGNKVSADCSCYVNNGIVVTVPVWDASGGTGDNTYYHIIGYAGFQITGCPGAKDLSGVWRRAVFQGPTTSSPVLAGAPLGVQVVK